MYQIRCCVTENSVLAISDSRQPSAQGQTQRVLNLLGETDSGAQTTRILTDDSGQKLVADSVLSLNATQSGSTLLESPKLQHPRWHRCTLQTW